MKSNKRHHSCFFCNVHKYLFTFKAGSKSYFKATLHFIDIRLIRSNDDRRCENTIFVDDDS